MFIIRSDEKWLDEDVYILVYVPDRRKIRLMPGTLAHEVARYICNGILPSRFEERHQDYCLVKMLYQHCLSNEETEHES